MAILAYGVNYRTASLDLRERVAFPEETLPRVLADFRHAIPSLSEVAIVSTCNRTELYCALDPVDEQTVEEWLTTTRPVSREELTDAAYRHWDMDAARHIIRVASGLDSQILGEPQIMGQVKTAYEIARSTGTLGPELGLLSQISLNTAKRVRTDTGIGRNPVSVASAAVALARNIFTNLRTRKALLLGAGETIALVAQHLREADIGGLTIANRTLANAETLARAHGAQAIQLSELPEHLADHDIVIASTGATLPVLGKGTVESAIRARKHRPMFMVDIAVPRDIEPGVGELPDVYLYSIDDLAEIIEENVRARENAALEAQSLVDAGAEHFIRERRTHMGRELITRFRATAEQLQKQEVERALADLHNGLPADQVIARLSQSLTNKLIHAPTVAIRQATAEGQADLLNYIRTLYQLD